MIAGVLTTACDRDLLNEDPPYIPTADKLYETAEGFQEGLNGLYGLARKEREGMSSSAGVGWQYLRGSVFFVGTDDISSGGNRGGDLHTLLSSWGNNNGPSSRTISSIFGWLYEVVNATNTIIDRSENPDVNWMIGSTDHKNRIVGEAYVFRAWAYRHLITLWGDVPLILNETTGENIRTDYERNSEESIRRQMVEDLLKAAEWIPWSPYNAGSMTKGVALTYLAEAYLALGEYAEAERYASICIGNGVSGEDALAFGSSPFRLMPDFAQMFKPSNVDIAVNTESLWTMQWAKDVLGGGDNLMRYGTVTYFTNQRDVSTAPGLQFASGKIGIQGTYENGSWGWGQSAMTEHTLRLYYESSTTKPVSQMAASDWKSLKYERRGDDKIIRKYFVLTQADTIVPGTMNSLTGKEWGLGDTVWITRTSADAARIENAIAMNYTNYSLSRINLPYPLKFATCDAGFAGATESHQNQMYMRLAEAYLIRAEARWRRGNASGAVEDVNVLRNRAEALLVTEADFGSTEKEGLYFILDERSRELIFEEHRRHTLSRMGREFMYERVKLHNTRDEAFAKKDVWLSIPKSVIDANRTRPMQNNPGHDGGPAIDW